MLHALDSTMHTMTILVWSALVWCYMVYKGWRFIHKKIPFSTIYIHPSLSLWFIRNLSKKSKLYMGLGCNVATKAKSGKGKTWKVKSHAIFLIFHNNNVMHMYKQCSATRGIVYTLSYFGIEMEVECWNLVCMYICLYFVPFHIMMNRILMMMMGWYRGYKVDYNSNKLDHPSGSQLSCWCAERKKDVKCREERQGRWQSEYFMLKWNNIKLK